MKINAHRQSVKGRPGKVFRHDLYRMSGSRHYFGATEGKNPNRDTMRAMTGLSWSSTGVIGVVALAGWLLGWPTGAMVVLWGVVIVLLVSCFVIEHFGSARSEDIIIDTGKKVVIFPKTMPNIQGTYPIEDLILAVRSENPAEAKAAVTRDYYVIIEGVLKETENETESFQVSLIGPGYIVEMNDEAAELRKLGKWRLERARE